MMICPVFGWRGYICGHERNHRKCWVSALICAIVFRLMLLMLLGHTESVLSMSPLESSTYVLHRLVLNFWVAKMANVYYVLFTRYITVSCFSTILVFGHWLWKWKSAFGFMCFWTSYVVKNVVWDGVWLVVFSLETKYAILVWIYPLCVCFVGLFFVQINVAL